MIGYYQYKNQDFECSKCSWKGKGESLIVGETFNELFEVHCPECNYKLTHIMHPTVEEFMQFGSKKEVKEFQSQMSEFQKTKQSQLKSIERLPDIEKEGVIKFRIKEEKKGKTEYLVIYADDVELWRELLFYEYFDRYIEIAKMLKQKYGSRMTDLIPDDFVPWMYGDCSYSEIQSVHKLRKSLNDNVEL